MSLKQTLREHWSLVIAGIVVLGLAGLSWWSMVDARERALEPTRVLVIVELEAETGALQWRQGDPGADLLATKLVRELDELGLDATTRSDQSGQLAIATGDGLAAARDHGARHLVQVGVRVARQQELGRVDANHELLYAFSLRAELEIVDAKTEEVLEVSGSPAHVVVIAESASDALTRLAPGYLEQITLALARRLATASPLGPPIESGSLAPLTARLDAHARAMQLRAFDSQAALVRATSRQDATDHRRELLGDLLGSERFIGVTPRSRVIALSNFELVRVSETDPQAYVTEFVGQAILAHDLETFETAPVLELAPPATGDPIAFSISADGSHAWLATDLGLSRLDLLDGEHRQIEFYDVDRIKRMHASPDGSQVLIERWPSGGATTNRCEIVDADPLSTQILAGDCDYSAMQWTADGRRIHALRSESYEGSELLVYEREPGRMRTLMRFPDNHLQRFAHSHDGRHAYFIEYDWGEYWLARAELDKGVDAELERLTSFDNISELIPNPTDPRVALAIRHDGANDMDSGRELLVFDPRTNTSVRISDRGYTDRLAGWSRDGRYLLTQETVPEVSNSDDDVRWIVRHSLR